MDAEALTARLAAGGFVAADEEAEELLEAAHGDGAALEALVERRLTGEPLAWITGWAPFLSRRVAVTPGVYVPRWQTELLARRALERLPEGGVAIDVCTGSGALAMALAERAGRVYATDVSPEAVACARANGVDAYAGDLFAPLPDGIVADVVVGVVPYVPTGELSLLQRDTFTFETPLSYDGGPDGCAILRRALSGAARVLRSGGALLLELGGDEAALIADDLEYAGYEDVQVLRDEDGDVRGIEATKR
ncbi:MAG TPA: HemK family protein methyltransferase [Baekduia sp.]|uniref:N5-glutamine methyltransferase family protein n=1 Tax=Baekduia sp. TaxID=2600305 RepID=UPI002D7A0B92|nr:HemK family protein methyltransferase [Baekduia sp.]HET6508630.1 HemK family protein methyltransferase [Baekduia sp.]